MGRITNELEALNTAGWIAKFRERRQLVRLEEACLTGLIDELTHRLLEYRQSQHTDTDNTDTDDEESGQ